VRREVFTFLKVGKICLFLDVFSSNVDVKKISFALGPFSMNFAPKYVKFVLNFVGVRDVKENGIFNLLGELHYYVLQEYSFPQRVLKRPFPSHPSHSGFGGILQ